MGCCANETASGEFTLFSSGEICTYIRFHRLGTTSFQFILNAAAIITEPIYVSAEVMEDRVNSAQTPGIDTSKRTSPLPQIVCRVDKPYLDNPWGCAFRTQPRLPHYAWRDAKGARSSAWNNHNRWPFRQRDSTAFEPAITKPITQSSSSAT